jgi:hypothetical protein
MMDRRTLLINGTATVAALGTPTVFWNENVYARTTRLSEHCSFVQHLKHDLNQRLLSGECASDQIVGFCPLCQQSITLNASDI